jgi:hypothetical protein
MKASKETIAAIYSVYQQIGFDIPEGCDGEEIIEMCIDADRLKEFDHPAADDEVRRMVNANGYMETLKILAEQLPL